jgi:hypothetical protein
VLGLILLITAVVVRDYFAEVNRRGVGGVGGTRGGGDWEYIVQFKEKSQNLFCEGKGVGDMIVFVHGEGDGEGEERDVKPAYISSISAPPPPLLLLGHSAPQKAA